VSAALLPRILCLVELRREVVSSIVVLSNREDGFVLLQPYVRRCV